jgi:uncharacterized protein YodC (DUF2158 family)
MVGMKLGDVARLKSGGRLMTVGEVTAAGVECVWFEQADDGDWDGPLRRSIDPDDLEVMVVKADE